MANLGWIIPLTILVCCGLALVVLWLSSRGKFMFLHCVALDKAEVAEPWSKLAGAATVCSGSASAWVWSGCF